MRILHTIRSVNIRDGGPIGGILSLAKAYHARGHSLEIASLDFPEDPWVRDCPVLVHPLGALPHKYRYSPEFVRWIQREKGRFFAVVVNGLWTFSSFGAWMALKDSETPYYVFPHGMMDPWFKRYYPLKHLKKWFYWPWAEYRVLRDANAVFFTSEEERLQARQSFWLYRCREEVVPYGLGYPPDEAGAQTRAFLGRFPGLRQKRLWLFLGRLHEKKGCDLLLRAFAKIAPDHPDLRLVMAGPDQNGFLASYRALADRLHLRERVIWTGMLEGAEKWGAFRSSETFILPSHQENFGLSVAESLACGVPVLISNKVNIWREVVAAQAGLAAEDTQEGTDSLLRSWLGLPEDGRQAMKLRAVRCFREKFYIDAFLDRMEALFKRGAVETRARRVPPG
jgi:glycosyltransferase involved in cell wall biosynthesis